jgi:hypothetical protein
MEPLLPFMVANTASNYLGVRQMQRVRSSFVPSSLNHYFYSVDRPNDELALLPRMLQNTPGLSNI